MKLLFAICGFEQGGVAMAFNSLAAELERAGHEVRVLLPYYKRDAEDRIAIPKRYVLGWTPDVVSGIPHLGRIWIMLNCLFNWQPYFRRLKCAFKYDKFVLYHGFGYDVIARWFRNVPAIFWMHEMASERTCIAKNSCHDFLSRLIGWSLNRAVRGYDHYVAVSDNAANSLREYYHLEKTPQVINNLVDVDRVMSFASLPQDEIKPSQSKNVLYVGRLTSEKGVDRLLKATKALNGLGYKFNVWIVGAGAEYGELADFAESNKLSNVRFLGAKGNPYPYMSACDLTVLPSREEGMGLVLWESILCGTPVIATKTGGAMSALADGRWGMLVENDAQGLQDGLQCYLDDPSSVVPAIGFEQVRAEINRKDRENRACVRHLFEG